MMAEDDISECTVEVVADGGDSCWFTASVEDLVSHSSYFDSFLSARWSRHSCQPQHVQLRVRSPGHVEACRHVLGYMASGRLPGEVVESSRLLLAVLELADFLGASQLVDDCLQYLFAALARPRPAWSLLLFCAAAGGAADSIADHPMLPPLRALATQNALQQLQDLEAVLQHKHQTTRLLSLPFELLLQLVSSFETRVAAESTVVTAVHLWLEAQLPGSVTAAQRQQLASHIRLLGLPRSYVGGVLPAVAWYAEAVGSDTLMQASSFLLLHQTWATNCRAEEPAASEPSHSSSSCQGAIGRGAALGGWSPPASASGSSGITSSAALGRMLSSWLSGLPAERAEFWRLALLREARLPSAINCLSLGLNLTPAQLAAGFGGRGSGAWQAGKTCMFAGLGWRLNWRFCDVRLQRQAGQRRLPACCHQRRLQPEEEEQEAEGEEEVDSSRAPAEAAAAAAALAAGAVRQHWQLQVGVSFSAYGLAAGSSGPVVHLALPGLDLQHQAAAWPGGSPRTRQALWLCGGVALQQQRQLVAIGQVAPCLQLLPTNLSSSCWDAECEARLRRFTDDQGLLHLRVDIHGAVP